MSERWPGGLINQTAPTFPYSGVWTLDQVAYLKSQGVWPYGPSDPYFYDVSLLLNGDGTNGAQNNTFLDSSTNNFTITRNGNTTQGSFSPYGNLWSNNMGTNNYFSVPSSSAFGFGNVFTVEAWVFPTSAGSSGAAQYVTDFRVSSTNNYAFGLINSSGVLKTYGYVGSGSIDIIASTTVQLNTWNHIAIVNNGSTVTLYLNGVSDATASTSYSQGTTGFTIGSRFNGSTEYVQGYISNLRVNNTALYTGTFTPSTAPLTAISGTAFLTAQSNRFIDNSSNNFTLTVNGAPSVQRFSPFNPTAPYSTSVIGGSGYFGTAGDYLVTTSSQVIPTGSYTIEAWVYTTSTSQTQAILAQGTGVGDANRTTIGIETSSGAKWSAQVGAFSVQSSFAVVPNTWTHVAMTFNGTTITLWVNGVNAGSTANVLNASNTTLQVGKNWGSYQWIGYISNARVSNTVRYTATFTPQTTPFTSDANTTFLGGMTNAGIPDLAMQNNLQTVGSAAVNTSVVKYGTGSLKFNGVGNYLTTKATPTNSLGSSNFTVEMWVYPTSNAPQYDAVLMARGSPTTPGNYSFALLGSGTLNAPFVSALNGIIVQSSVALTLNTWSYVAYVRSGNNWYIFVNGILTGSTTNSTTFNDNTNDAVFIGTAAYDQTADRTFTGYIDDLRVTNGYARYTANFTPPTAALPTY